MDTLSPSKVVFFVRRFFDEAPSMLIYAIPEVAHLYPTIQTRLANGTVGLDFTPLVAAAAEHFYNSNNSLAPVYELHADTPACAGGDITEFQLRVGPGLKDHPELGANSPVTTLIGKWIRSGDISDTDITTGPAMDRLTNYDIAINPAKISFFFHPNTSVESNSGDLCTEANCEIPAREMVVYRDEIFGDDGELYAWKPANGIVPDVAELRRHISHGNTGARSVVVGHYRAVRMDQSQHISGAVVAVDTTGNYTDDELISARGRFPRVDPLVAMITALCRIDRIRS